MMVTGIVLTGLGGVSLLGGVSVLAVSASTHTCFETEGGAGGCETGDEDLDLAGAMLLIAGGTLVAVGIPLLIVGAQKVPAEEGQYAAQLVMGADSVAIHGSF